MTTGTLTAPSQQDVILDAWQVYRRSQQIPFPARGAGDLMKAQSRLWHLLEPHTRTDDRNPFPGPDMDAIDDAIDVFVAAVEWACGADAAAFVAGDASVSGAEGGEAA